MEYSLKYRLDGSIAKPYLFKWILFEDKKVGSVIYRMTENCLLFSFELNDNRYLQSFLHSFIHQMICRHHSSCFITNVSDDSEVCHILENCLFKKKMNQYIYRVDPIRNQISNRAFNENGYLINQGLLNDIPFGNYSSKDKGCGWIAAYNLLRMNGTDMHLSKVIHGLDESAIFHEVMGENVFRLYHFIKNNHLNSTLEFGLQKSIVQKIEKSNSGILLYSHKHGAHYVAYQKVGDHLFHFYNGIYGKRNDIQSIEKYLNQYALFSFQFVILVK